MDDTLKLIRDMIEDDGFIVYKGKMLFKSENEDNGFVVGSMPNAKLFTPDRRFGFDIVSAVQYLYDGGKE